MLAVIVSGRVIVPVSPDLSNEALKHVVDSIRPHIIITDSEQASRLEQAAAGCSGSRVLQTIHLPEELEDCSTCRTNLEIVSALADIDPGGDCIPLSRALHNGSGLGEPLLQIAPRESDQPAAVLFTSGSTGFPKGAQHPC